MEAPSIVFRPAHQGDIPSIRRLLHANSRNWDESKIGENIATLFLLHSQKKVLGVLCGSRHDTAVKIDWIEAHPLFPEKVIREIMAQEFAGIFWRTIPPRNPSPALNWGLINPLI